MVIFVGLTGGIACGKSTVSKMFLDESVQIVDADQVSLEVMAPGTALAIQVAEAFKDEPGVRVAHDTVDRPVLGDVVFKDAAKRRKLVKMTQGPIFFGILRKMLSAWWNAPSRDSVVVLDLPLLFETQVFTYCCEQIVVVSLPVEEQMARLMKRNEYTEDQARSRITAQMPTSEKIRRATHVIDNSGSLDSTRLSVQTALKDFKQNQRLLSPLGTLQLVLVVAITGLAYVLATKAALI